MPGGDQAGQLAGVPRQRQELEGRVRDCRVLALVLERANLQDAAADERMSCDEFDRLCHVLALQQVKTQKGALSLQERAFCNLALAVLYPHGNRSCFGREFTSRDPRSPAVHRRYPLCDGWPAGVVAGATGPHTSIRNLIVVTPSPQTAVIGHEAARALDRYLRVRSRHAQAWRRELWLG